MNVIHKGKVIATYPTLNSLPWFQDDATVTLLSQAHRPAGETHELIIVLIEDCGERSVLEIARHLRRKPTPYLRQQLRVLVERGVLAQIVQKRPNGALKFTYRVGI